MYKNYNDFDSVTHTLKSSLKKKPLRTALIIGLSLLVFIILKPWVQIGAGERGVILNFEAVQQNVLGEGLHFRIPIMQKIIPMDVKVQKATTDATASSSNLQEVSSTVAINYHVIPNKVNTVYQNIGI